MVNKKFMTRVLVTTTPPKKKVLFEQILSPEQAALVDFSIVIPALRMLFPMSVSVNIEVYDV